MFLYKKDRIGKSTKNGRLKDWVKIKKEKLILWNDLSIKENPYNPLTSSKSSEL